jgi:hypothetical protein
VRIPNEPANEPGSALGELLRLQTQFQARLAEETMSYLRRLQGAAAPAAPGTVLVPDPEATLAVEGRPGERAEFRFEVENRQRVHCMVRPMLGELVDATGVTWQPDAQADPPSRLVAPDETAELSIAVTLPRELPAGMYRGALVLLGFRNDALPVAISVGEASATKRRPKASAAKRRPKGSAATKARAATKASVATKAPGKQKPAAARRRSKPRATKPGGGEKEKS